MVLFIVNGDRKRRQKHFFAIKNSSSNKNYPEICKKVVVLLLQKGKKHQSATDVDSAILTIFVKISPSSAVTANVLPFISLSATISDLLPLDPLSAITGDLLPFGDLLPMIGDLLPFDSLSSAQHSMLNRITKENVVS